MIDVEEGYGDDEYDEHDEIPTLIWIRCFVGVAVCAYVILSLCLFV